MSKTIKVAMRVMQTHECWCEVEVTDQQYNDYCDGIADPIDFISTEEVEKVYQESGQFDLQFMEEELEVLWDDHIA